MDQLSVVLAKFPFTNQIEFKARPAVIISNHHFNKVHNFFWVCPITSKTSLPEFEMELQEREFDGKLKTISFIRTGTITSMEKTLFLREIGKISQKLFEKLKKELIKIFLDYYFLFVLKTYRTPNILVLSLQNDFSQKLSLCNDFADIFELVKEGVEKTLQKSRAGLMLGLADLGGSRQFYLGAYYLVASNIIVMNSFPLKRIMESRKELFKPYVFMILLHEYLHSLGLYNEAAVREVTLKVCKRLFGKEHLASLLAKDISRFLAELSFPGFGWFPDTNPQIEIVSGFDKGHLTYIT